MEGEGKRLNISKTDMKSNTFQIQVRKLDTNSWLRQLLHYSQEVPSLPIHCPTRTALEGCQRIDTMRTSGVDYNLNTLIGEVEGTGKKAKAISRLPCQHDFCVRP